MMNSEKKKILFMKRIPIATDHWMISLRLWKAEMMISTGKEWGNQSLGDFFQEVNRILRFSK